MINKIIIVGGGSAGWMTAATLIHQFPKKKIVLIESPNIPTVGVGESTIVQINRWKTMLGIEDKDFMKHCDASYKLGIRFEDFYKKGDGGFFYPFGQVDIEENRSGSLILRGTNLNLQAADDTNFLQAVLGGAVTLYHTTSDGSGGYNATPRVATSSSGATVSGSRTVTGDLNITGDVNSTSVTDLDVTDKTITVGVGQTSAQAGASGLEVDRTDGTNPKFLYNGTQFEIDDGDGNLHGIIHEGNSADQTYTIDGGTF